MRRNIIRLLTALCAGLLVMSVCACGGARKINTLWSKGLYSGNEISFPIKSSAARLEYSGYGLTSFYSKQNPDKLYKIIEESNSELNLIKYQWYSGWTIGDSIFIRKDNGDGTQDYFSLILTSREAKEYWYEFNALRAEINYAGAENLKKSVVLLMPVHLIPQYDKSQAFYMDVEYQTKGSLDEFFDFYKDAGWFDMEQEDNGFLIKGFHPGLRINDDAAKVDFAFRFVFRTVLDINLFKIVKA